jgi:uncharacterized protein YcgL (UPF0745 family)
MLCDIYKGTKKAEMYLYIPLNNGFKDVPKQLLESFGELELVMKLELTKAKKLARVDAATVIQEIFRKRVFTFKYRPRHGMHRRAIQRGRSNSLMSEFWQTKKLHEMSQTGVGITL